MKTYKGFDKDLKCRGFQYEIGKEYETDCAEVCVAGFHACKQPIDVFRYYPPAKSRFCEVMQSGDISESQEDSKIASTKIKILQEIGIKEIINAQKEYIENNCKIIKEEESTAGECGISTAGYRGISTAGDCGVSTAGNYGVSTAGDCGASTAGNYGVSTAGYRGISTAGDYGVSTAGDCGISAAGNCGISTAGYRGISTAGNYGIAASGGSVTVGGFGAGLVRGKKGVKIKGGIGAIISCAVEEVISNKIETWASSVVDGEKIKEDTWYTVKNGVFVEFSE